MDADNLRNLIEALCGRPYSARLPPAGPLIDASAAYDALLDELRDEPVVLFAAVAASDLDHFFHLRLAQILRREPPLRAVSVVILVAPPTGATLAGGFAARFRAAWPFERCLFATHGGTEAATLTDRLGLPVADLDANGTIPQFLEPRVSANQRVAVQVQPIWGRCGSTTGFQNQVQDLVEAGYFTIRVFAEADQRRGATLARRMSRLVAENSADAGAHINAIAVPPGGPTLLPEDGDAAWAAYLLDSTRSHIDNKSVAAAAICADAVVANHITRAGTALALAPRAKFILSVRDDLEAAHRALVLQEGGTEQDAEIAAAEAGRAQRAVLAVPDLCLFVSVSEEQHLRDACRHTGIAPPRSYISHDVGMTTPRYDLLLVGDRHDFNIRSVAWFLDEVWHPHLQPLGLSVAVAGRVTAHIDANRYDPNLLHLLGFVDDLDALRATCRMSVVPDQAGTGIAVKTLSALAHGHPVSATTMGLRGLDPAVAAMLPACADAESLAADIRSVLSSVESLMQRQRLVQAVQQAIQSGQDFSTWLATLDAPSDAVLADRAAKWQQAVAPAQQIEAAPRYVFAPDVSFALTGSHHDEGVLVEGWHGPETWGRWMDGFSASLHITLDAPIEEACAILLDVVLPPHAVSLSLRVEDADLDPIVPVAGWNIWYVPKSSLVGKRSLRVQLRVSDVFCAADAGTASDDRVIGLGVRGVRIVPRSEPQTQLAVPTFYFDDEQVFPMHGTEWDGQVIGSGWHPRETWGRWMSGTDAVFSVKLREPPSVPVGLDLDLVPSPIGATLSVSVADHVVDTRTPVAGSNIVIVPLSWIAGRADFQVRLHASEAVRPSDTGGADRRILGVACRAIRVLQRPPTVLGIGEEVLVTATTTPWDLLRPGWHQVEDWGCWSNGPTASLQFQLAAPLAGTAALELGLVLAVKDASITISMNGQALTEVAANNAVYRCIIPSEISRSATTLSIVMTTSATRREASPSGNGRILGIGLRAIRLVATDPPIIPLGKRISLDRDSVPPRLLWSGWHAPEAWGCWTSGPDATVRMLLQRPLTERVRLELELAGLPEPYPLTIQVNDYAFPARRPKVGRNVWSLPAAATEGHAELSVWLRIAQAHNPRQLGRSADDRVLGVGVHALRLLPRPASTCRPDETIRIGREMKNPEILGAGWHKLEPWGCWSLQTTATVHLAFDTLLDGPLALDLNLSPPLLDQPVTVTVNTIPLPKRVVHAGSNIWDLPPACYAETDTLDIELTIDRTVRPTELRNSTDDRPLGVGLRAIRIITAGD